MQHVARMGVFLLGAQHDSVAKPARRPFDGAVNGVRLRRQRHEGVRRVDDDGPAQKQPREARERPGLGAVAMDDVEWPEFGAGRATSRTAATTSCTQRRDTSAAIDAQPLRQGRATASVKGGLGPDRGIDQRYVMAGRDLVAEKLHDDPAASSAGGFDDMTSSHHKFCAYMEMLALSRC